MQLKWFGSHTGRAIPTISGKRTVQSEVAVGAPGKPYKPLY